jgi:hypothetical protein
MDFSRVKVSGPCSRVSMTMTGSRSASSPSDFKAGRWKPSSVYVLLRADVALETSESRPDLVVYDRIRLNMQPKFVA